MFRSIRERWRIRYWGLSRIKPCLDLPEIVEGLDTEEYFSTIYTGPYHCLNDGCEYVCKVRDLYLLNQIYSF